MNEIERDITIEHKGETLHMHVHIHLTEDEIRKIVVPAMLGAVAAQVRANAGVVRYGNSSITTSDYYSGMSAQ